jgi:hypothetical protein
MDLARSKADASALVVDVKMNKNKNFQETITNSNSNVSTKSCHTVDNADGYILQEQIQEKNFPPSSSMSNHTSVTLATTRSYQSSDSKQEKTDNPAIILVTSTNTTPSSNCSPIDSVEPPCGGLVESQSSASQASVVCDWVTKYDTYEKDNYDSYDSYDTNNFLSEEGTEETCEGGGDCERREDAENNKREQHDISDEEPDKILAVSSSVGETSIWTCGMSELIEGDQEMSLITKEDEPNDVNSAIRLVKDEVVCTESNEEKEGNWNCSVSDIDANQDNEYIEIGVEEDCHLFVDQDDDEDSAMEWFANTFHTSDAADFNGKSHPTMRLVGSIPLKSATYDEDEIQEDSVVPDDKDEQFRIPYHEAMATELDPLAFQLDRLSSQEEMEEEVIFHDAVEEFSEQDDKYYGPEEEQISSDSCRNKQDIFISSPGDDDNQDYGNEIFSKVTEAINAICITSRAHQLPLREVNTEVIDDRINYDSKNSFSSAEDPNIEVELYRNSNDEEVDNIIVVDAVAKALRRSKETKHDNRTLRRSKKKKHNVPGHLTRKKFCPNKICSDAMDVLMSLTLMECWGSDLPNEVSVTQSFSISTLGIALSNSGSTEVSEVEPTNSKLSTPKVNDNSSISVRRRFHDDNESPHACRDAIIVAQSRDSDGKERMKAMKNSGYGTAGAKDTRPPPPPPRPPPLRKRLVSYNRIQKNEEAKTCNEEGTKTKAEKFGLSIVEDNDLEAPEELLSFNEILNNKDSAEMLLVDEELKENNTAKEFDSEGNDAAEESEKCYPDIKLSKEPTVSSDEVQPTAFQPDNSVLEKLDIMVDHESFSIDGFSGNSFSENDPIREKPHAVVKTMKQKRSKHELLMLPLRDDGKHSIAFTGLSTGMSSSFELASSLSSDDCRIPSPPQCTKKIVMPEQEPKQENFVLPIDPLPVQNVILPPMNNIPPRISLEGLISLSKLKKEKKKKKKKKKNKALAETHKNESTALSNHSSILELLKDPIFDAKTLGCKKQKKLLPHLAINKMIRNAKKTSSNAKKALHKNPKNELRSLEKHQDPEIGSIAKNSLRLGRKTFSLPSHSSSSSRKFGSSKSNFSCDEEEDQENCSPNPCKESKDGCIEHSLPKGIMRVNDADAPKTPSNENRSVHFDEKQLANKVEKGIMVLSNRKSNRPMRKLEELMLQITAVQNSYDKELENIVGVRNTAQGYIC